MAEVNDETKNQYAREEKFLGCPPVDLLDDIINSVEDYVCDGLDTLEKTIVQEAGLKDKRAEVGQALDGVMEKLDRSIAKNFDKFELYSLQNILLVPSDIQLPVSGVQRAMCDVDVYDVKFE